MTAPGDAGYDPTVGAAGSTTASPAQAEELGADLYEMYRAGVIGLPLIATRLHEQAVSLHGPQDSLTSFQSSVDGSAAILMGVVVDLYGVLFDAIDKTALACQDSGTALVQIAASFAEQDQAAAAEFGRLLDRDRPDFTDPLPPISTADVPDTASDGTLDGRGGPV